MRTPRVHNNVAKLDCAWLVVLVMRAPVSLAQAKELSAAAMRFDEEYMGMGVALKPLGERWFTARFRAVTDAVAPGQQRRVPKAGRTHPALEALDEGRDIALEYRWTEGSHERFPALIAELIASGVEVIVTAGTPAAFAVKNSTNSIPSVMVAVGGPVSTGLVASLARPRANLTGLTSIAPDPKGKRLALLREVVPGCRISPCYGIRPMRFMPPQ